MAQCGAPYIGLVPNFLVNLLLNLTMINLLSEMLTSERMSDSMVLLRITRHPIVLPSMVIFDHEENDELDQGQQG